MLLSKGNAKLGEIPNISLPPIVTCKGCEEICGKACYANKFYKMRPSVRKQWDANYQHLLEDMPGFFEEIYKKLTSKITYKFFRWHVGGDILNGVHFSYIQGIARLLPDIRFLIFTKQYDIVNDSISDNFPMPENLTVIFSAWPGLEMNNPHNFHVAWLDVPEETRIPDDTFLCFGSCENCGVCWDIKKIGKDVKFKKH